MPRIQSWIVCATSGRWTAALRVALARRQAASVRRAVSPTIQEVRNLGDMEADIHSHGVAIGFIEVGHENLAAVLELLAKNVRRDSRFVALLEYDLSRRPGLDTPQSGGRQSAADALTEAGALCVVDSPRQIGAAIEVAEHYCAVRLRAATLNGGDSIADRAWASLPWQDA